MPCLVFKTDIAHVLAIIDYTFLHSDKHIDGVETDLREVCLFCLENSLDNFDQLCTDHEKYIQLVWTNTIDHVWQILYKVGFRRYWAETCLRKMCLFCLEKSLDKRQLCTDHWVWLSGLRCRRSKEQTKDSAETKKTNRVGTTYIQNKDCRNLIHKKKITILDKIFGGTDFFEANIITKSLELLPDRLLACQSQKYINIEV